MSNLALDYQQAGRLPEAVALLEETLKLRQARLGTDHPDTLASMALLGQAYRQSGNLSDAIPILEQTHELRQAKLGADHPDTLRSMSNLALVLEASNRVGDAEVLLDEVLKAQRRRLPADDIALAETLGWLAHNLRRQKRVPEAERLLGECLTIREKKLPDDWVTYSTRSVLGGYLLSEHKYAEAEPLLLSGYNEMKARESRIPPPSRARLTEAGERIVQLYKAWRQPEKAKEWRAKLPRPAARAESKP
jgi:tetratricopeptide (TPR) repeat protein